MIDIKKMVEIIKKGEDAIYKAKKQLIGEKIKCMLEIAREGEAIPYQLELTPEEIEMLVSQLEDKELVDNRNRKSEKSICCR